MKNFISLVLLLLSTTLGVFSQQKIIIRYTNTMIQTPIKINGYLFITWDAEEFKITDSLSYSIIKQGIDSLKLCSTCRFPDVRQQIIVINGEEYDIISSDGGSAMEKNGKSVVFDKPLQRLINQVIKTYEHSK